MTAARILVTGSRNWTDRATIERALSEAWEGAENGEPVVLVSGACPSGADRICEEVWGGWNLPIERHPAEWGVYGNRAGYIRNAQMVSLRADLCLAFIRGGSRGASMTAALAEEADIPTVRYEA